MSLTLTGIHHVSAITGNASGNVDFYTKVMGLRLVKKTVNQDDVSAYHLFYGDEKGSPGTEFTFFDWPGAKRGPAGSGEISSIGLRVPSRSALEWWTGHLDAHGVKHNGIEEIGGRATLICTDPEGQRLRLVADSSAGGTPWSKGPVPAEMAIRGLGPIRITVIAMEGTALMLTELLGFRKGDEYVEKDGLDGKPTSVTIFETGTNGGAGSEIHVALRPDLRQAGGGVGAVHHVAFRTPDAEQHQQWQQSLERSGVRVTPVIDRFYFKSIYFREPGGVLYEIATDGPGFATDENEERLGEKLALPPFLEPRRAEIEAGLQPI